MKQNWKMIGWTAMAAGVLIYPVFRLYKYIVSKSKEGGKTGKTINHNIKAFAPAFRGRHALHHRHNNHGHN
jgi:hypothetical protein